MTKVQQPIKHSGSLIYISFDLSWFFHEIYSSWLWFSWKKSDHSAFVLTSGSDNRFLLNSFEQGQRIIMLCSLWHHTVIYLLWNSTIYMLLSLFSALFNYALMCHVHFLPSNKDRYYLITLSDLLHVKRLLLHLKWGQKFSGFRKWWKKDCRVSTSWFTTSSALL